ncbi:MAG: flagellar biosynthesis protein FlhA [Bryobacterales bacterium]|nr:flagellar biosynthesis protein FlhA [Bryobacterales bacterium]
MAEALSVRSALRQLNTSELAVPAVVLAIVLVMIVPVRPWMLDVLISANITVSVVVLLVSMYITRPVEFSVFPTALLLLTLFRLALNISSSRAILLNGNIGTAAAGEVIEAFGSFVVGGNYVIGVVIFLVLIAIQYVVINHGAVRISEVTARFTLDAMPGKQMSIDSDLNAGLIDENEARARRKAITSEAEFYGAMDGASRFTQRDAVASILITAINILAGFLIGVFQHGMALRQALETYTVLTIGDGLVTVIPALMVSVSGGMIVTRASSDARLGADIQKQMFGEEQPLWIGAAVLAAMAGFPGLPKVPFLVLSAGLGTMAWRARQKTAAVAQAAAPESLGPVRENLDAVLRVEPLAVEVGLGLVRLVEGAQNSVLLRRIAGIRRQLAAELGYLLPPVRVTDNLTLKAREYVILLKGVEVARYELLTGHELAITASGAGRGAAPVEGIETREPAFGIPALWVKSEQAEMARAAGYAVVDPASVLGTHLAEVARRHAHELFSRQDTRKLLDRVAEENPKVVEDLVPKLLSLAQVQKVLQNLLRERVSIRDTVTILEALGEAGNLTRNTILLTEYVRQGLARALVKPYLAASGELAAFFFDPALEQMVESGVEHGEHASQLNLAPQRIREIVDRAAARVGSPEGPAVAITTSGGRHFLRQILEPVLPNLAILAHNEIPPSTRVVSLGVIQ